MRIHLLGAGGTASSLSNDYFRVCGLSGCQVVKGITNAERLARENKELGVSRINVDPRIND